ncbi:MAG TPA: hypothetical protein VMJ10_02200 [Kofleriaceae bacterium]|nr:hypothetical protein [Kofleriaceae bacterium]
MGTTTKIAALALIAGGCGSSSGHTPDATAMPDAAPNGASFATAIDLTSALDSTSGTMGMLPDTKTKLYYKLTLVAGDRIVAATQTNAEMTTDGSVTDTIVTIFDSAETAIAQDDDAWPRFSTDSQVYFQATAAGTYYLTVDDCNAESSSGCYPASGVTDFKYTLFVDHTSSAGTRESYASSTQDGTTAHADKINYAVPSGDAAGQYGYYVIDGNFASTTATHVFQFTAPAAKIDLGARNHVDFWVQPISAENGDGSTSNVKAWITAGNGVTIASSADQTNYKDGDNATNGPLNLTLPASEGVEYYLFVQNTATTSTPATDYYFIQHYAGSLYFGTAEGEGAGVTGMNDTVGTAQVLATPTGADAGSFFADGDIGGAGDVDYYEVDPPSGTTKAAMSCSSARQGSGVVGLTATLYAADGTTVIHTLGPETATADLIDATEFTVPTGTMKAYMKVTATSQSAAVTGTFYLCSVAYSAT